MASRYGLDRYAGRAAASSKAAPWQQWLSSQRSGGNPAAPQPGSDEDILNRARSRQQSAEDVARAVGTSGDPQGHAAPGLLSAVAPVLDAPKSAVVGAISGLLGEQDMGDDISGDPVTMAARRFWQGLSSGQQYGTGDISALRTEADADPLEKWAKRGVAFAGDVAADPLTYLSLGGSVVGKRLAGEAVHHTARTAAKDVLGDKGVREWAARSTRVQAPEVAARRVEGETARRAANEARDAALQPPSSWAGSTDEWLSEVGSRQFAGAAGEAFQEGGPIGLRRWARETLGDDAGEEFFKRLPRDVQGGIRMRQPFHREAGTGVARTTRQLGDGRLLEQFGLDDAAVAAHRLRNQARASTVGQAVGKRFTGRDGELYGDMIAALLRRSGDAADGDDLSGTTYAAYQGYRQARKDATQLGQRVHQQTQDAIGHMEVALHTAPDVDAARGRLNGWVFDPQRVDELRQEGVIARPGMPASGPGVDALEPTERAAATAALHFHDYLRHQLGQLRATGLSVGELDDYIPRIITQETREALSAAKPVRGSMRRHGGTPGYDPQKMRKQYVEATVTESADGQPQLGFRHLTPEEANAASGRAVFETDPATIIAEYGDAARRLVTRTRFANRLHELGVVARGDTIHRRILAGRYVQEFGETWQQGATEHAGYLDEATRRAEVEVEEARARAEEAASRLERAAVEDREALRQAADVEATPRSTFEREQALAHVEKAEADLRLQAAERRLAEAREQAGAPVDRSAETPIELLVDVGEGERLYAGLFRQGGVFADERLGRRLDSEFMVDSAADEGADPDLWRDALSTAGWQRQRRRITDEAEIEALEAEMRVPRDRLAAEGMLDVDEWVPGSPEVLERAQRAAFQRAVTAGREQDDWLERAADLAGQVPDAVTSTGEVHLGPVLPEDPDGLATVMRFVEEFEQAGWRLTWKQGYKDDPGGWYVKNLRRDTRVNVEGRSLAAARRMRDAGFEVADPPATVGTVSAGQAKVLGDLGDIDGVVLGESRLRGRGLDVKGGKPHVSGSVDGLRRAADMLDAADLAGADKRSAGALAKKLRATADQVEDAAGQTAPPANSLIPGTVRPQPEPVLDDFLDPALRLPGDEAERVAEFAARHARREWDEAVQAAGRRQQRASEALQTARVGARRAERQTASADFHLDDLRREVDQVAGDRQELAAATARIMQMDDVDEQFDAIGELADGVYDFHQRHAERLRTDMGRVDEAARETLAEARRRVQARIRQLGRSERGAKTGREELDPTARAWQEAGLTPVGGHGDAVSTADVVLPPELDLTYAPEVLRDTVHKMYRASGPESADLRRFMDGVYRPYFQMFKVQATIGRGYGYHIRNTIGGIWNNWLRDVTVDDHNLSARLVQGRQEAWRQAMDEKAAEVAKQTGRTVDEARNELPHAMVAGRAEELLEKQVGGDTIADGVTLYDLHRMSQMEEIGWKDSRIFEGVHDMLRRQEDAESAKFWQASRRGFGDTVDAPVNMFRQLDPGELNRVQRVANASVDWWWINHSKEWAQRSEDFIRHAAFIRGVRDYGAADGGQTAALLSRALHFDYQDLSDFERVWMRGTFIPFYVWSRNNVPLQMRAMFKEPGKMNRMLMANDAARDLLGDDEQDVVPEWMQEKLGWTSKFTAGGSPIVLGVESPATDLNRFLKVGKPSEAARGMVRQLVGNVSPVFKLPIEHALEYDSFTGAPFNPRGVEAPLWYRAVPGLPKRTDSQGTVRAPTGAVRPVMNALPWVGQATRLVPGVGGDQYGQRLGTSWASTLAAAPASTLTPRQEAGELRARSDRLNRRTSWGADQEVVDRARELLEDGWTPEQVKVLLKAGM